MNIEQQRAAFEAYLKDCDIHGIVPDTAGAFNYAWQAASKLDRQGRGEPVGVFTGRFVGEVNGDALFVVKAYGAIPAPGAELYAARPPDPVVKEPLNTAVLAKCDGNHGGPRCADPGCWNDSPQAAAPAHPASGLGRLLDAAHTAVEFLDAVPDDERAKSLSWELSNAAAAMGPAEPVKVPSDDTHDYLGLALELESACKTAASQTTERAMLAAARCLRDSQDRYGQPAQPAASAEPAKRWPFVETPGEFAYRFSKAFDLFDGDIVACVRHTLIENPATIAAPVAAQSSVPESNLSSAPHVLNTNDKAMWVLGWNDCRAAMLKGRK